MWAEAEVGLHCSENPARNQSYREFWSEIAPQSYTKLKQDVQAFVPLINQSLDTSCLGRGVTLGGQLHLAEGNEQGMTWLGPISSHIPCIKQRNVLVPKEEWGGIPWHLL